MFDRLLQATLLTFLLALILQLGASTTSPLGAKGAVPKRTSQVADNISAAVNERIPPSVIRFDV